LGYYQFMNRAMNLFASGLASLSTVLVPTKVAHVCREVQPVVPTNSPSEAIAGDFLRVGAQIRIAQEEKKNLRCSVEKLDECDCTLTI
jgi:hypothetical protein